jgi:hypothetical protein
MNRSQCIREILVDNDNLTARQIMNILIQKYPQIWNDKVAFYADAGKEKSESWVSNQLTAEIHRQILNWKKEGKITSVKINSINTFTATDSFKNQIKELSIFDDNVNNNSEIIISEDYEDDICEDCLDKGGIVYILKSDIFNDVYKIGKTIDLDKRMYDLSRDNRYGVFKLQVKGWIRVKQYGEVEKMFHSYFNKYRLHKENFDLNVSTELFKTNFDLFDIWKNFIKLNYLDNPLMKSDIIDYKF